MRVLAAMLLVPWCLAVTACRASERTIGGDGAPQTIVLVTIDTWRWDANGFLGSMDPSPTPFLDQLAQSGVVLERAIAPVPLTGPSHWSMLSGRWPWRDGVRVNGDPAAGRGPTLPELLRAAGWRTGGFVSCAVLDGRLGFSSGFDRFDDELASSGRMTDLLLPERSGAETVSGALAWLGQQPRDMPVFLWVHLFEPHFPHPPDAGRFDGPHAGYYADVERADRLVQRLWRGVEASGRQAQTVWLVLADHGEGLGEHGETTHGTLLHGATVRIPMLIFGAGIEARRHRGIASTVDIGPTIAQLVGVDPPPSDGVSVLAPTPRDRAVPLESLYGLRVHGLSPVTGLRTADWFWEQSPVDHLWNLAEDPAELNDLATQHPEVIARLSDRRQAFASPGAGGQSRSVEIEARLRALGYAVARSTEGEGDARAFVLEGEELHARVLTLQQQGDLANAEAAAVRFLERYPGSVSGWLEGGFVAVGRGDFPTAERRFSRGLSLDPENPQLRLNLGNVFLVTGRPKAAEAEYRAVLGRSPHDAMALYNLGLALERQNRTSEALDVWKRFLASHPEHRAAAGVRRRLPATSQSTSSTSER